MLKVSIILPVYNSKQYIKQTIECILNQNMKEFELIVIDDGSTDGSGNICDEISKVDERVKVFHKDNGGICDARNYGLRVATGEYIAFLDHDDTVKQGFLKDNYNLAKKYDADIVKFGCVDIGIRSNKIIYRDFKNFDFRVLDKENIKEFFLYFRFVEGLTYIWDGLFKKELLERNNILFNPKYKMGGEDREFCSNCFLKAKRVVFSKKSYYEHYIRYGYSTSTKWNDKKLQVCNFLRENLDMSIKEINMSTKRQKQLYLLVFVKEYVIAGITHLIRGKASYKEIRTYLKKAYELCRYKKNISLEKEFLKTRIVSYFFIKKYYILTYWLIKLRTMY